MAQGFGDVVPAAIAQPADNAVAQGRQCLRGTSGMGLAAVFAQRFVADVVDLIFDGPLPSPEGLQVYGLRQSRPGW